MATLNINGYSTLLDIAKRLDPNGKIARIAETLDIDCPLLQDMPWVEANGPDGHLITTRSALPSLTWRKYNQGVLPTKSQTAQFIETCGMLDGVSKVDVALAKRNGNAAEYRASEDISFVSSYNRTLETAFFYSSQKTNPEQITGLSPRLDALTGIPYSSQVIPFGAASGNDSSSMWLVGWGPKKVYGIYPKGSIAGLQMDVLSDDMVDDGSGTGAEFLAHRTKFSWQCGLAVEDARYVVRLANIDDDVVAETGSGLITKMVDMLHRIQSLQNCNPVFYANRTILTYLHKQALDGTRAGQLTFDNPAGGPRVLKFGGVPIHQTDAILSTEAPLV
jgi:hypothetical protein